MNFLSKMSNIDKKLAMIALDKAGKAGNRTSPAQIVVGQLLGCYRVLIPLKREIVK